MKATATPTKRRKSVQAQIAKERAMQERIGQIGMLCMFVAAVGITGFIEAL